ncbi:glycosyl hydrolase family 8 [Photobacterium profundum]|uniref:Glucanase n=1 Tax=Photobacterium profundum (strain SS9) TaxID=298386 RepID=Q6LKT3_PHOPR|nr:glycosyl hydrolase family 8 [Photobacterium profundum]CAG22177.1 putative endoglucanase [Photobacterium profundum SS9]
MKWISLLLLSVPFFSQASLQTKAQGCDTRNDDKLWSFYKQKFVNQQGRVIDNGNESISHSESQGYGMLMAEFFNDHQSFKQIWHWTEGKLQRHNDALFSWKWQQKTPHIPDPNNASDGDIFIAWALLKADKKWPGNEYDLDAKAIINELASSHIISIDKEYALLPARQGFQTPQYTVVNPSYWVYPAFNDFAIQNNIWTDLNQSGRNILDKNQFGQYQLPSDWLEFGESHWRPATQFPARFSYSSYRIPLYLIWGGYDNSISDNYRNWLLDNNTAWLDVNSNEMANYGPPQGAHAIAALVQLSQEKYKHRSALPHPSNQDDYYSASLILFSHIAFHERYCQ